STTSYIASMLRPEIVADLGLAERGLRMVPCEPGLQVVCEDARVLPWWSTHERTSEEIRRISSHDADAFARVTERLHELARSLPPLFLAPPRSRAPSSRSSWRSRRTCTRPAGASCARGGDCSAGSGTCRAISSRIWCGSRPAPSAGSVDRNSGQDRGGRWHARTTTP